MNNEKQVFAVKIFDFDCDSFDQPFFKRLKRVYDKAKSIHED